MSVFLIGYRGSGKSTVGKLLASSTDSAFIDSDEQIVRRAGKTIREIFAQDGEAAFRDLETLVVADLAKKQQHVIALGGGALHRGENRAALAGKSHQIFFLRCTATQLLTRIRNDPATSDNRPSLTPLAGTLAEIEQLLSVREPIYVSVMTAEVDVTHLTTAQAAERILALL